MKIKYSLLFLFIFIFISEVTAQVYVNPVFEKTDCPWFHINAIEKTKDSTFVFCTYSAESSSWANISEKTFIRDVLTGKQFKILKSEGLPFSPLRRHFHDGGKFDVKFCFPAIGDINKIDFIENENNSGLNVYGVDLQSMYESIYQEMEPERFSNMASFYDSADDTIKALQYKSMELKAAEYIYGKKSEPLLVSMLGLCLMYDKYSYYKEAIDLMNIFNKIDEEVNGKYNLLHALQLRTFAQFYSHAEKYDLAIKKYKESIDLFESLHIVDNEYALALSFIASDYFKIGDNEKSIFYQQKCIDVRRKLGNPQLYIEELCMTLMPGGGDKDVFRRIDIVKNELSNLPLFVNCTSSDIAILHEKIASIYSIVGQNDSAVVYCNKSLEIMKNNGTELTEEFAEVLTVKSQYQRWNRHLDDAIITGEEAKNIFDSLHIESVKYAELLSNLASAYGLVDYYERAIQLQEQACIIFERESDWFSLISALTSMSNFYHESGDLSNAEKYIKKAINVLSNHDDAEQYIMTEIKNSGNRLLKNKRHIELTKNRINIDKVNLYQELAMIYYKQERFTEAIALEKKRGEIINEISDKGLYFTHLVGMSTYYLANNQYKEAISYGEKSVNVFQNISGKEQIGIEQFTPQLGLVFAYFKKGDINKAIKYAEAILVSAPNQNKVLAQCILSYIYWEKYDYSKSEKYMSDALDLLQIFIRDEITEMTTEQRQRIWDKYESYFLMYRSIIDKSERADTLISKLYNYVLFSKSLLLDTDIFQEKDSLSRLCVDWKSIQQKLSENDIAIEFISTIEETQKGYHTYHALVIDKTCLYPRMITLYNEADLMKIRQTSNENNRDVVGNLIWQPILNQYRNVKNIYFSPDDILHLVPIEYFNVGDIENLFDKYNVYRLSSTKEIVMPRKNTKHKKAMLYGGLEYDNINKEEKKDIAERGGFEYLYNTFSEIQEIDSLLENNNIVTTLFSNEDGTEDSFKRLSGKDVNLLHFATHGMYVSPENIKLKKQESNFKFLELLINEKDPVKEDIVLTHSFLVMSGGNKLTKRDSIFNGENDGILTAKEISQTKIRGLDLVVLSACETAFGELYADGIYGLQRGFKKAGANTILMSLDKVDDEATKYFMVEFYKNLMAGKSKIRSLREAQKYLRCVDNGKYEDPKYWASFIMLDGLN